MVYLRGADGDADEESPDALHRLGVVTLAGAADTVLHPARTLALSGDGAWVATLGTPVADTVGADLTVRELASGRTLTLGNVDGFAWRDTGALLAVTLRTASGTGNGVTLFEPSSGTLRSLDGS